MGLSYQGVGGRGSHVNGNQPAGWLRKWGWPTPSNWKPATDKLDVKNVHISDRNSNVRKKRWVTAGIAKRKNKILPGEGGLNREQDVQDYGTRRRVLMVGENSGFSYRAGRMLVSEVHSPQWCSQRKKQKNHCKTILRSPCLPPGRGTGSLERRVQEVFLYTHLHLWDIFILYTNFYFN